MYVDQKIVVFLLYNFNIENKKNSRTTIGNFLNQFCNYKLTMLWFGKKKEASKQTERNETEEMKLDLPELPELYPDSSLPEFEETNKFMEHEQEAELPKINNQKKEMKKAPEVKKIVPETKIGPAQRHEDIEQVFSNITQEPTKEQTPKETMKAKSDLDSIDFSKLVQDKQKTPKMEDKNLQEISKHIKANQEEKHNNRSHDVMLKKHQKEANFMRGNALFLGNKNYLKIAETLNQLAKLEELDNLTPIKKRETELESKFKRELETIYNRFLEVEETIFGGNKR